MVSRVRQQENRERQVMAMIQKTHMEQANVVEEHDALHMWADIDAHLQFADQVIQRSQLAPQVRTTLLERMQGIQRRRADQNMYLAVVGEFSTGKSTFINALLQEELLKATVDVTTAISTRICYGAQRDLEVRFRGVDKTFSFLRSHVQLWQRIQSYSSNVSGDINAIQTYIHAVTADNDVAAHVESVVIHHPASFLTNNIVIIDTPGINAEYAAHAQIANHVVQHEADAAVVIIPAPVPLSQTLTGFLTDQLRPYAHRCLFVVTQMDKIQAREQTRLLDNIRKRLTKVLGMKQPVVLYETAPQIVLDILQQQPVAPALQHWYTQFNTLEQALWDRLRRERALTITESLLRLMAALFEELNTSLRERQTSYDERRTAIQREVIQDIPSFTEQQRTYYQRLLGDAASDAKVKLERAIDDSYNKTQEQVRQAIFGATDASDLKSTVTDTVKQRFVEAGEACQKHVQKRIKKLGQSAIEISRGFDASFIQEYRKLQVLAGAVSSQIQTVGDGINVNTESVSYSADQINRELDGSVNALGWGGAAVGATIGTMLLPGIGTLAGLFVGPLLIGLFGPSLDERKNKMWDAIAPVLNSSFSTIRAQSREALNNCEKEVQLALDQRINAYMQQYTSTVNTMIQQQQKELASLNRLQKAIQSDQGEIERRNRSLKEKQQQIARKSAA